MMMLAVMNFQSQFFLIPLIKISCFHHFGWQRRTIFRLERIKQNKQDLLAFSYFAYFAYVCFELHLYSPGHSYALKFPVLKNKIIIKPMSLSGDHTTADFKERIDDLFYVHERLSSARTLLVHHAVHLN